MRAREPAPRAFGLGLIELLVGLAIAGVLAGLAYPSYQSTVIRLRRAEALALASQVQTAQESHRSRQPSFATLAELGLPAVSPSGRYRLDEDTPSPRGYTLRLIAQGSQAADVRCRHLRLQVDGFDSIHASGPDAQLDNNADDNRRCWGS